MFTTWVCRLNSLAVVKIVHLIDGVDEQNSWFCPVPSGPHNHIPKGYRVYFAVNFPIKPQLEWLLLFKAFHELIGHAD